MNRDALLKSLGLTEEEFQDLLRKFANFQRELNPDQLKVLLRSLPSLEQARRSLCPNPEDLIALFREESDRAGEVVLCFFAGDGGDGN